MGCKVAGVATVANFATVHKKGAKTYPNFL